MCTPVCMQILSPPQFIKTALHCLSYLHTTSPISLFDFLSSCHHTPPIYNVEEEKKGKERKGFYKPFRLGLIGRELFLLKIY